MFGLNCSILYRLSHSAFNKKTSWQSSSSVGCYFRVGWSESSSVSPHESNVCVQNNTWWFRLCFTPHSEHLCYKNNLCAISAVSHYRFNPPLKWLSPTHTHINPRGKRLRADAGMRFNGNCALASFECCLYHMFVR